VVNTDHTDIRVGGRSISVPSAQVGGTTVITTGRFVRIAAINDENFVEHDPIPDPASFVSRLKETGLKADIFTFAQRLPKTTPSHPYHLEWDNVAIIPITTFSDWWERRAEYSVRKAVKRAKNLGVVVKPTEFTDAFVEGVCRIYNDTPVRQGRAFWHYQKDFHAVKRDLSTHLERSVFLGAYYRDKLIGFMKIVSVGSVAAMLQIFSQSRHFDKKPTNALIAKAVEVCHVQGM